MRALQRHQLAWLTHAGWSAILARPWDLQARACLAHWAMHRLPLVVTRQTHEEVGEARIALGLPAPTRWGRRRLALQVPRSALASLGEFPQLDAVHDLLPRPAQPAAQTLRQGLAACRTTARVFGSYGWQTLSGLDHVRAESDLDLCVAVDGARHADAVTAVLQRFDATPLRLDGELAFGGGNGDGGGAGVAWREWAAWRAGRTRALMVKRLAGACLQYDTAWCETKTKTQAAVAP